MIDLQMPARVTNRSDEVKLKAEETIQINIHGNIELYPFRAKIVFPPNSPPNLVGLLIGPKGTY